MRKLNGQTLEERFAETGSDIPDDVEANRGEARARRMASNHAAERSVSEPLAVEASSPKRGVGPVARRWPRQATPTKPALRDAWTLQADPVQ